MSHTVGRLRLEKEWLRIGDGKDVDTLVAYVGRESVNRKGYDRRLVACWNAFDGLPTEKVECFDKFRQISGEAANVTVSEMKRLEQERDELLKALRISHLKGQLSDMDIGFIDETLSRYPEEE